MKLLVIALVPLCAACSASTEPGVSLEVMGAPTTGSAAIDTDLGYRVELAEALWTVSRVELEICETASKRLYDALIPAARAHGVSSPTASAIPVVESLLGTQPTRLAALQPPAARYCALRMSVSPADADAAHIDDAPSMLGRSLSVSGWYVSPQGERRALEIASTQSFDDLQSELELELARAGAVRRVHVEKDARRWFDGIDFSSEQATEMERTLIDNLARSITLSVE